MWKMLLALVIVTSAPIGGAGAVAAQSATIQPATVDHRLGALLTNRAPHLDPGYGTGEGALVAAVTPGSPADKAGLKPRDIIRTIAGRHVHDVQQLRNRIARVPVDQPVALEIERDGKRLTISVLLGPRS